MTNGATAAYRGFLQQTLYTLSRIVSSPDDNYSFQPEGEEDLAIFNEQGEIIEAIQVKAYSNALTVSTFDPENPNAFFHRTIRRLREHPQCIVRIASFGPFGPEMAGAWRGDSRHRNRVSERFINAGFSEEDIQTIFNHIQLEPVNEDGLRSTVFEFLQQTLAGGEPESAVDLLSHWLMQAAEARDSLSPSQIINRLTDVGRILSERATHHSEWFTSIIPLVEERGIEEEERQNLSNEFYQGIAATYSHILAGVDVVREDRLQEINCGFDNANIVIIKGASGQGKSSLAYRYLHDYVPELGRFRVCLIQDRQHATRIARALSGHANALRTPMFVFIDVSPQDLDWPELIRELAHIPNLRIMITVREEDFARTRVSRADFHWESIDLQFDQDEARHLYNQLAERRIPDQFLDFDEAWQRFGGDGPLLEFAYLVTQNETLRDRLEQQVNRLQDLRRTGALTDDEITLLRLAAVASEYGARLNIATILSELSLPEVERTLDLFEREYLIRRAGTNQEFVEGLHPIRSRFLVELLTDPIQHTWEQLASTCLPALAESDIETFLHYAFSRHPNELGEIIECLDELYPQTWTGLAGIVRALLWLGIQEYTNANSELIQEAEERFGQAWWIVLVLNFDIASVNREGLDSLWAQANFLPEEVRRTMAAYRARQTSPNTIFQHAEEWLSRIEEEPMAPETLSDWSGYAEITFWIGYRNIDITLRDFPLNVNFDSNIESLPLDILGDVVLAYSYALGQEFTEWLSHREYALLQRYQEETLTVALENDGETVRSHFILERGARIDTRNSVQENEQFNQNMLHEESLHRIRLLRKLLPTHSRFGSQGYGHRLLVQLPHDDTDKPGIPIDMLHPERATNINGIFAGLVSYQYRPSNFTDYVERILELRSRVVSNLERYCRVLDRYFRRQNETNLLRDKDIDDLNQLRLDLGYSPLLPRGVVDEWGYSSEISRDPDSRRSPQTAQRQNNILALRKYRPYLSAWADLTFSINTFYLHSQDVLRINPQQGRANDRFYQAAAGQGVASLSVYNLAEAIKVLPRLQREFRNLFSHLISDRRLRTLEERERQIYFRAWSLWYQFAFHPYRRWQDSTPTSEAETRSENALVDLRRAVRRRLRQLSDQGIDAEIVSEDLLWGDQPALWIRFDVDTPPELHNDAFDVVLNTVREAIGTPELYSLEHYVLDIRWSNIVLVPTIRHRLLYPSAWRFLTMSIIDPTWDIEEHPSSRILLPIPEQAIDELQLEVWDLEELSLTWELVTNLQITRHLIAHLCDFVDIPEERNEAGSEILSNYVRDWNVLFSTYFQQALDSFTAVLGRITEYESEELEQNPELLTACELLIAGHDSLVPGDVEGEFIELNIDIQEARTWMPELTDAIGYVEMARLYWLAGILQSQSRSR